MTVKPIAVVKPGVLDVNGRQSLTDAGYAIIESDDPECVRLLHGTIVPLNEAAVFHAAMHAIAYTSAHQSVTAVFGRKLSELLADSSAPGNTKP